MPFQNRKSFFRKIEELRDSKLISFVTSDRQGAGTVIFRDCIEPFVDTLDSIGNTKRISLLIQTDGGDTAVAWRLVNLIKMYCDEFEIIVPFKSLSAGTLIALGAEKIIMTKQAVLGPIDPSLNHSLGPINNQGRIIPVSVEAFNGYFDIARKYLSIKKEDILGNLLSELSKQIHPLTIGEVSRSRTQIRDLAHRLLSTHIKEKPTRNKIVEFLCSDSGTHDYTLNRREAESLGLNIEKPDDTLYELIRAIRIDFRTDLEVLIPFNPILYKPNTNITLARTMIENVDAGSYRFQTDGHIDNDLKYRVIHEGWTKLNDNLD